MSAHERGGRPPHLAGLAGSSVADARAELEELGWSLIGIGDWAVVLSDPTESWCARLVPFDPAYLLFAEEVLSGPPNRWLPRVAEIVPLLPAGHLVLIERLWPVHESAANDFCLALGLTDDSGNDPPVASGGPLPDDRDIPALRSRLENLLATGAERYPRIWGGSDIRAGNVMADTVGQLKLIDPVFVAGRTIAHALLAGDAEPLAGLSREQLEGFLAIACFHRDEDRYDGFDDMTAALDRLDVPATPPRS